MTYCFNLFLNTEGKSLQNMYIYTLVWTLYTFALPPCPTPILSIYHGNSSLPQAYKRPPMVWNLIHNLLILGIQGVLMKEEEDPLKYNFYKEQFFIWCMRSVNCNNFFLKCMRKLSFNHISSPRFSTLQTWWRSVLYWGEISWQKEENAILELLTKYEGGKHLYLQNHTSRSFEHDLIHLKIH